MCKVFPAPPCPPLQLNRGEVSEAELKERQAKAMADPEIQSILTDPIVRNVSAGYACCLLGLYCVVPCPARLCCTLPVLHLACAALRLLPLRATVHCCLPPCMLSMPAQGWAFPVSQCGAAYLHWYCTMQCWPFLKELGWLPFEMFFLAALCCTMECCFSL